MELCGRGLHQTDGDGGKVNEQMFRAQMLLKSPCSIVNENPPNEVSFFEKKKREKLQFTL